MSEGSNASEDAQNNGIISALMQEWLDTRVHADSPLLAPAVAAMQDLGQAAESLLGKSLAAILLDPSSNRAALEILQKHFEHVSASVESENELSVAVALSLAAGANVFVYHGQAAGSDSGDDMIESFAELAAQDWVPSACKGLFWQAHQKCLQEKDRPASLSTDPKVQSGSAPSQSSTKSIISPESQLETLGNRIGPYKLLRKLGEGGMGVVYLARQEHPLKRDVALKIIKPGMDSKQIIARFEAERQALALLDHPNIAHVYDAGTTQNGRPYFVMEHVDGIPITEHCDRHRLTIDERLDLFLRVCAAVQHAHQKGIIHRDIKPSNIQVSIQGEQFVPKVIDFGVAKATSQLLTERTLITEQGQFVGTPEYMSPEQAEMTTQDIDTRSDIYSLGIVLYEFLTGTLPFDSNVLRSGGIDHIRQVIREENPKTPSTRLSTIVGEESTKVAQLRRTDLRSLGRTLRGDLDWITIKAMEKDRTRRYQTAQALMEDIQRHLNNEPVLAGPPSKIYRLKKLIQKHRTRAIAAAIIMILIAAVAIISTMYVGASKQGKNAESLEHKGILSKAQKLRSNGQFQEALSEVETILPSEHIGLEARLLHARLVLELQGPDQAIAELQKLVNEQDDIACQAYFLLAAIYLRRDASDPNAAESNQQQAEEYQNSGEKLFSESAEAFFNRSMMADTVLKTLESLNEAINHDPRHYDSREARALAYYALRRYDEMATDASVMIGAKPDNAEAYALRAIAWREKKLLDMALKDHDKAIVLSSTEPRFYNQRRQTYMQMSNYKEVLSDAQKCVRLQPDEKSYHFHVFCAFVALGHDEEARAQYSTIITSGLMDEQELEQSAAKYVSDTLAAGLKWHPGEQEPQGTAFLAMNEAAQTYRQLAAKGAKRMVANGFHGSWSPNGDELVYSRGIVGCTGIEVVNLTSGTTRLLTVPGFNPSWSPDGRYIVFTRTRQPLLLADLVVERTRKEPPLGEREIWRIKSDGTGDLKFLAKGYWPAWSQDPERVIYHSKEDMRLYSISVEGNAQPKPVGQCPGFFPVVSPDKKYVAYRSIIENQIRELPENTFVASLTVPLARGVGFLNWSPDGSEVCMGVPKGLWLYNIDKEKTSKLLSGSFGWCSWSKPDLGKIAIGRVYEQLHHEIWVADIAALRPGRPIEAHCQEMHEYYSHRIDIDPNDTWNYFYRAEVGAYLEDNDSILADLDRYADILKDPLETAAAYNVLGFNWLFRPQQLVNPEIGIDLYRKAHEMVPENWLYLFALGVAHYRVRHWDRAIETLVKSTELPGGDTEHNSLFLAMSHWKLGDKSTAESWYYRATEQRQKGRIETGSPIEVVNSFHLEAEALMGLKAKWLLRKANHTERQFLRTRLNALTTEFRRSCSM